MKKTTGFIIRILREEHNLSQKELAYKLKVSPSTIGMYEQGYRTPSIEILLSLSKLFNVSVDYIICNEFNTDNKNDNLSKKELQILNIIKKVKGDLSTIDLKKLEIVLTYAKIEDE